MMQTVTRTLAEYAASTSIANIPKEVRERAKQVILDEMASAHFGRRSLAGDLGARYAASLGGPQEGLIFGTRLRVPAQYAALANGAAGHGEEVDGTHIVGGHPGATVVHGAVAVAERQCASGADLINAVVLAYDVGIRLVAACGGKFAVRRRFHLYSDFLYALGAAVAACRLMGLEPLRHGHAMALCTFQCNGLGALFQEKRHVSKSFCNGQYAMAGVTAAMMAAAGLEGSEDVIGTRAGILDAWGVEGGAGTVTQGLGADWSILGANFKFINAGQPIHTVVEAALALLKQHGLNAASIESIQVGMPSEALKTVDNRAMHHICVQDMVCAAVVQGGLSLRASPFPEVLTDPDFIRLRSSVQASVDPELDHAEGRGATVSFQTAQGSRMSLRVPAPRGHCTRGAVTWQELEEKWCDGLPHRDVAQMVRLARRLDELDNVKELVDAFAAD